MTDSKGYRLWSWMCSRGFVFVGYVMVAVASIDLYRDNPPPPYGPDFSIAAVAGVVALTLILAALASAHAVVYGITRCNSFMIKLEIPSLRILAVIVGLHGVLDAMDGAVASGALQVGLAALLVHEMRAISHLRKAPHGGLIHP